MRSPDILQQLIFIAPLLTIFVLALIVKFPWRMAVYLWLVGPLVGDMVAQAVPTGEAMTLRQSIAIALALYPFAIYPLGCWAATVGVVGWLALHRSRLLTSVGRNRLMLLGGATGLLIGLVMSFAYAYATDINGPIFAPPGTPHYYPEVWIAWETGGAVAGVVEGIIVAHYLQPSPPARTSVEVS